MRTASSNLDEVSATARATRKVAAIRHRARERRERVLREDAKARQGTRTDLEPSPKLGEGSRKARETSKVAAIGTGYGR